MAEGPRWVSRRGGEVPDLQAKLDKTRRVATGRMARRHLVAEPGEVVPVGKPVLTLRGVARELVSLHPGRGCDGHLGRADRHDFRADDGRRRSRAWS